MTFSSSRAQRGLLCVLGAALVLLIAAQFSPAPAQAAGQRFAVVIGNADYAGANRLDRPVDDAIRVKEALERVGFTVRTATDADKGAIERVITRLAADLSNAGSDAIGFVYYAGHGGADRTRGANYIMPIDFTADDDVATHGVAVDWIMRQLEAAGNRANVIVFDACRDPPVGRGVSAVARAPAAPFSRVAREREAADVLVAFAQREDRPARDDGAYAETLAELIEQDGLTLEQMFDRLQNRISARSNSDQIPWVQDGITATICLVSCTPRVAASSESALSLLQSVQQTRPRSDLGQADAVASLIAQGRSFEGFDFQGFSFAGAEIAGLNAMRARADMANFANGRFPNTNFVRAVFSFASFEAADLSGMRAERALFEFADGDGLIADEIVAPRSTWFAARLRGARFRGADLRGASFVYADLQDADFSGADLTNVFFNGANLRGARFDGAVVANTDVVFAVIDFDDLPARQRGGFCASTVSSNNSGRVRLVERVPNSRYDDGFAYEELGEYQVWAPIAAEQRYPRCAPVPADQKPTFNPPSRYDDRPAWSMDYDTYMDHELLEAGGRRGDVRARLRRFEASLETFRQSYGTQPHIQRMRAAFADEVRRRARNTRASGAAAPAIGRDGEGLVMAALRLNANLVPSDWRHWESLARGRLRAEQRNEGAPWPALFPAGATWDQIDGTVAAIYAEWTRARASAAPMQIGLRARPPRSLATYLQWRRSGSDDQKRRAELNLSWRRVINNAQRNQEAPAGVGGGEYVGFGGAASRPPVLGGLVFTQSLGEFAQNNPTDVFDLVVMLRVTNARVNESGDSLILTVAPQSWRPWSER